MTSHRLLILFALLGIRSLDAQDDCVALLRHGIYNTYRTSSGSSSVTVAQSQFCSSYNSFKNSGQSAGLEASYKVFSGKATYDQQSAESLATAVCYSSTTAAQADQMLNSFSSVIDANAIGAYKSCTTAAKSGLIYKISPSETSPHTISVEVRYQPGVGISAGNQRIDGVTISQDAGISSNQSILCQGKLFSLGNQATGLTLTNQVVSMTCTRSAVNVGANAFQFNNQSVLAAPVTVSVDTNLGQIRAELPLLPLHNPPPPSALTPLGTVVAFAGASEPAGWMICDGRELQRSAYPELFSVINSLHGQGNGSTTFNLPNYRGRFLRGTDPGGNSDPGPRVAPSAGGAAGNQVGSIEDESFKKHTHVFVQDPAKGQQNIPAQGGKNPLNTSLVNSAQGLFGPNLGYANTELTMEGGEETRPKNAAVNFLIKVQ